MNKLFYYSKENKLCFGAGEICLIDEINTYEKPIYLYDSKTISNQIAKIRTHFPKNVRIFYAVKANSNRDVLKHIRADGVCADVVSRGEIVRCLDSGFLPEEIIFSGVGKTESEIRFAIENKIFQINVESVPELNRIISICHEKKASVNIGLRVNPDIDVQSHPYISTGLKESKFGINLDEIDLCVQIIKSQNLVELRCLTQHLGSQIFDLKPLKQGLVTLKKLYLELKNAFPKLDRLDLGGGFGVDYQSDNLDQNDQLLVDFGRCIDSELKGLDCQIFIEPGRFLVARCGVLISQIQYIKKTANKCFVILDSGMNHFMRPSLYDAKHQIYPLLKYPNYQDITTDVVGPICESGDFFAKDIKLQFCKQNDFLAVLDVGAYGFTMANQYNLHDLPLEILK